MSTLPGLAGHPTPVTTAAFEILIINPNTNAATTAVLGRIASAHLQESYPERSFSARAMHVADGPAVILDDDALRASADFVVASALSAYSPATAGIIVGAIGDPAVDRLRRMLPVPVIGIGEAGIRAAAHDGGRFGLVTTTPGLTASLIDLVHRHGVSDQFTGIRLTASTADSFDDDRARLLTELQAAVQLAHDADGASAVIIGGGPLAEGARELAAQTSLKRVRIIEPLPRAVDQIIAAIDRGLSRCA